MHRPYKRRLQILFERGNENMKRLLVLVAVFLLFLSACAGNNEKSTSDDSVESNNDDALSPGDVIEIDASANEDRDHVYVEEEIIDDDDVSLTLNEIKYDPDSEEYKLDFDIINKLDEKININGKDYYFDGDSIDDRGYFRNMIDSGDSRHTQMLILNHEDKYDEDLQELGDSLEFSIEISVDDDLLNRYDVKINIS